MLKDKLNIIILSLMLTISIGVNVYQAHCWNKACDLIECYDRVVDTIDEDYFMDAVSTTDEWINLEKCVEENHLGCGCTWDIMPVKRNQN